MIPLQRIRDEPDAIREGARRKRMTAPVDDILACDTEARRRRTDVESLRAEQKRASSGLRGAPTDAQRGELTLLTERIQRAADFSTQVGQDRTEQGMRGSGFHFGSWYSRQKRFVNHNRCKTGAVSL